MNIYSFPIEKLRFLPGLITGIPAFAIWALTYTFTAISLYTMAERRGIRNPWLAWIPVANMWVLGSLSDQYRYVVHGEYRSKRRVLLVLSILPAVLGTVIAAAGFWIAVRLAMGFFGGLTAYQMMGSITNPVMWAAAMFVPLIGVKIAEAIVYFMALYDVFASCDPENKVLFLVMSIFFRITRPVFLFICRGKEAGMPPRKASMPDMDAE